MRRFLKLEDGGIYDAVRGVKRDSEELFLMLGEDLLEEDREFLKSYLRKNFFRESVSISDTILVRGGVVTVKSPRSGVPPFSIPIEEIREDTKELMHPDGLAVVTLTNKEREGLKFVWDTCSVLNS